MTQTSPRNGTPKKTPTPEVEVRFGCYLVDLSTIPAEIGKFTWIGNFRELMRQVHPLAVVNHLYYGKTGRVMIEILAPDPDGTIARIRELMDGEGPEVQPL